MATEKFIAKHLTCAICQDEYQDPRRLSCQHVYCLKCLQAHLNSTAGFRFIRQRTVRIIGFNCPECRKTIRVPRPHEPRDVWASQITKDYKTTCIQADIREGTFGLSEPSPTVAEDPKREKKTEKETNEIQAYLREGTVPLTKPKHSEVPQINDTVDTEEEIFKQSSRIISAQVTTVTEEERFPPRHTRWQNKPTTTEDIEKPSKKHTLTLKGELVRVISPQARDSPPEYYDLVVLVQADNRVIVTLDLENNEILTFTLDDDMEVVKTNSHNLGGKPWRVCKVSNSQVAVTISEPNGVLICTIDNNITIDRLVVTKKHYDGIAVLSGKRFVLTTKDNLDLVKENGKILKELKVSDRHVKNTDNSYVISTKSQNIVVTDCGGNTLSCVTQDGKVVWRKKNNPLSVVCEDDLSVKKISPSGVACDADGSIYVVDNESTVACKLTSRGRFVCKVVEASEIFSKPSGIAVDGTGYLYVICDYKNITIWELRPPI